MDAEGGIVRWRPSGPKPTFARGEGQVRLSLNQPVDARLSPFKGIKLRSYSFSCSG